MCVCLHMFLYLSIFFFGGGGDMTRSVGEWGEGANGVVGEQVQGGGADIQSTLCSLRLVSVSRFKKYMFM